MPYPSKTSREAILEAAIRQVETDGLGKLSLRSLAASLDLATNALYRYFADRAHLEAAIANEALLRLYAVLAHAALPQPVLPKAPLSQGALSQATRLQAQERDEVQAVRRVAKAYLLFAQENPALYNILMTPQVPDAEGSAHEVMWAFTVNLMSRVAEPSKAAEAAVALWAFLHGIVTLEQGGAFGPTKPRAGFAFGLNAFLAGLPRS